MGISVKDFLDRYFGTDELKEPLEDLGLPVGGTKKVRIDRIVENWSSQNRDWNGLLDFLDWGTLAKICDDFGIQYSDYNTEETLRNKIEYERVLDFQKKTKTKSSQKSDESITSKPILRLPQSRLAKAGAIASIIGIPLGIFFGLMALGVLILPQTITDDVQNGENSFTEINVEREHGISNEDFTTIINELKISQKYIEQIETEKIIAEAERKLLESKLTDTEMEILTKAGDFLEENKPNEAIELYDILSNIDPNESTYAFLKALALIQLENFEEAIIYLDRAIASPDEFKSLHLYYFTKADMLNRLEKYDEALETIDKAIEIWPGTPLFLAAKAYILVSMQDYDNANALYDKALEISPQYVMALNGKGINLMYLGNFEEAIVYFDKALQIDPDNEMFIKNKESAIKLMK